MKTNHSINLEKLVNLRDQQIQSTSKAENEFKRMTPLFLHDQQRRDLINYFKNTWDLYELLFSSIIDESTFYQSPDPLRNPLIFYYGHTAVFYVNKLKAVGIINNGLNSHFEEIFARGVDPALPKDLNVFDLWPTLNEVKKYRQDVYDLVTSIIHELCFPKQITSESPLWAIHMSLEHDRIHFETSSVLIRQLNVDKVQKPSNWHYAPSNISNTEKLQTNWIQVNAGTVQLGKSEPSELFGWDNEFGDQKIQVDPFYASKNLITNAEYLEFVNEGAYNNEINWSEDGWKWKLRSFTQHPKFWIKLDDSIDRIGGYNYRAMFDEFEMPLDWPVEVNKYEAEAYLKWKGDGFRFMTEAEFRFIVHSEYGKKEPAQTDIFNLNIKFGSPSPVGFMENYDHQGFHDLYGNVWDWLDNDFYPIDGFKSHPLYADFSEPYFDDQHSMLLGGAWATSGTGASQYYRLWFRDYFYQHAGFRMAKDIER